MRTRIFLLAVHCNLYFDNLNTFSAGRILRFMPKISQCKHQNDDKIYKPNPETDPGIVITNFEFRLFSFCRLLERSMAVVVKK